MPGLRRAGGELSAFHRAEGEDGALRRRMRVARTAPPHPLPSLRVLSCPGPSSRRCRGPSSRHGPGPARLASTGSRRRERASRPGRRRSRERGTIAKEHTPCRASRVTRSGPTAALARPPSRERDARPGGGVPAKLNPASSFLPEADPSPRECCLSVPLTEIGKGPRVCPACLTSASGGSQISLAPDGSAVLIV